MVPGHSFCGCFGPATRKRKPDHDAAASALPKLPDRVDWPTFVTERCEGSTWMRQILRTKDVRLVVGGEAAGVKEPGAREWRALRKDIGTGHWTAPEVSISRQYDEKADVFSFGMVMYQGDL